jgi:hypothetical protein
MRKLKDKLKKSKQSTLNKIIFLLGGWPRIHYSE